MKPEHDEALVEQCRAICKSGRFETGQGTCALICMDQLGSARSHPCAHAVRVHGDFAQSIRTTDAARIASLEAILTDPTKDADVKVRNALATLRSNPDAE